MISPQWVQEGDTSENLQHLLQKEAGATNDCAGDEKPGPSPLLLPVDHGFANRKYRDGGIGGIDGQQVGLHLGDQPDHNGKTGNDRGDLVSEGHVFPIHTLVSFSNDFDMPCGSC